MAVASRQAATTSATLTLYVERVMEFLWLLTAATVPLIFVPTEWFLSEAVNAYVEVPKTTALRTLAGMLTILWIIEWVLKGGLNRRYSIARYSSRIKNWLVEQPGRWMVIAAIFYVVVAIISTLLSTSFWISMWGEVSGQYGYSAYTTVSYFLLFVIVATHLKTRAQLWRLLGVMVATGFLLGVYAIMQHYGGDPLNLGEGGTDRVSATMANPVFAGAAFVITTLMTLGTAVMVLDRWGWRPWLIVAGIVLLAVQFMAVYWTGSRGSWLLGVPWGLLAILGLPVLSDGISNLRRGRDVPLDVQVLFGLIVLLSAIVLFGQITLLDLIDLPGLPLFVVLVDLMLLLGLLSLFALQSPRRVSTGSRDFAKLFLVMEAGLLIALAVIFLTPSPSTTESSAGDPTGVDLVQERLSSIEEQAGRGGLSHRPDIWKASWGLVIRRPWFGFEDLSISYLRPLTGYGPELFKYTFPLESPLGGLLSQAHNFFLHHWVEQGLLGLFSSLGLFVAFFGVGLAQLWRNWEVYATAHKWVLLTFLAIMVGRVAEMLVGVSRESDLVTTWILMAIFVVLVPIMVPSPQGKASERKCQSCGTENAPTALSCASCGAALEAPEHEAPHTARAASPSRRQRRRERSNRQERRAQRAASGLGPRVGPVQGTMFVLVPLLVIFIGWLSWDKNVDYAWAARLAASARDTFQEGRFQDAERLMSQASAKAPDVPIYYHNLAGIYDAYREFGTSNPDQELPTCEQVFVLGPRPSGAPPSLKPFARCAEEAYLANFQAFRKNSNSPQAKLTVANSTLALALLDFRGEDGNTYPCQIPCDQEAIRFYTELTYMIPSSWPLFNALGMAYLRLGRPEEGLTPLAVSAALTKGTPQEAQAHYLLGLAFRRLERNIEAAEAFENVLAVSSDGPYSPEARNRLADVYSLVSLAFLQQNRTEEAMEVVAKYLALTQGTSSSAVPLYLQGIAFRQLEDLQSAVGSLEQALEVDAEGPNAVNVHAQLADVFAALGDQARADEHRRLGEELSEN